MYGAYRAHAIIMTHPNHEHLLKVLRETRSEFMAGRGFDGRQSSSDASSEPDQAKGWQPEGQDAYSSTKSSSSDTFDEDTLLTDEEIARQNQGGAPIVLNVWINGSYIYPSESRVRKQ